MTAPASARASRLGFLFVTLLLDTLGLGVAIPVVPGLIGSFLGGDVASLSNWYGALAAVYSVMQFVFAPILGALSDQYGRRKVILASLVGAFFDYVLLAVAPSLGWLVLARVISGITGASFSAATAFIADVTPPERRAQAFGLVGVAFGLGFILGPALGGALGEYGLRLPFWVSAGLNLANAVYGWFVLPESLAPEHRRPFSWARANPFAALRGLGRTPLVRGLAATFVTSQLAQQILQGTWAIHGQTRYGWSPRGVGLSLTAVGVAAAIVQGGLIRVIVPRIGERAALVLGTGLSAVVFTGFGLASQGWMIFALILPFALRGVAGPSAQALLTREVGPDEQGALQGALASVANLTAIAGPLLGTALFGRFGDPARSPYVPGAPFFLGAACDVCGLILVVRLFGRLAAKEREGSSS